MRYTVDAKLYAQDDSMAGPVHILDACVEEVVGHAASKFVAYNGAELSDAKAAVTAKMLKKPALLVVRRLLQGEFVCTHMRIMAGTATGPSSQPLTH